MSLNTRRFTNNEYLFKSLLVIYICCLRTAWLSFIHFNIRLLTFFLLIYKTFVSIILAFFMLQIYFPGHHLFLTLGFCSIKITHLGHFYLIFSGFCIILREGLSSEQDFINIHLHFFLKLFSVDFYIYIYDLLEFIRSNLLPNGQRPVLSQLMKSFSHTSSTSFIRLNSECKQNYFRAMLQRSACPFLCLLYHTI